MRVSERGGPRPPKGVMKVGGILISMVLLLLAASCTVTSCSVTVESGEVGIKTTKFGPNPGVQLTELRPGFHWEGIGEKIITYPTRPRVYSFTREANADGNENEEIAFADQTGLPMTADIQMTIKVQEDKAADLFAARRLMFDELIENPIRNDTRSFVSKETEKVPVSCSLNPQKTESGVTPTPVIGDESCEGSLMGTGRQAVLQRAAANLAAQWAPEGVQISNVQWVGTIRYPEEITSAIKARTQTEQRTLQAQAKEAEARANANAMIETARGVAESTRLRGEALRANPEIIQQIYAERSTGLCPPGTEICVNGVNAWALVPDQNKNSYD